MLIFFDFTINCLSILLCTRVGNEIFSKLFECNFISRWYHSRNSSTSRYGGTLSASLLPDATGMSPMQDDREESNHLRQGSSDAKSPPDIPGPKHVSSDSQDLGELIIDEYRDCERNGM